MQNSKFILNEETEIYPGYLDQDKRKELKNKYANKTDFMKCGCKPNENLFYGISEDLRIYPKHNNYVHEMSCCRYKDSSGKQKRQSGYIINDQDGEVTAFLKFDPRTFSLKSDSEKEQDNEVPEELNAENKDEFEEILIEKDNTSPAPEEKEPELSLSELVRSINVDTYTEKIMNNKNIDSKENFSKSVYFRMKKIKIPRMKKTLGDMTLEKNGVRFFYLPVTEINIEELGTVKRCYVKTVVDGKEYSNFVYPDILEKAIKDYEKRYGETPGQNSMIAGFQYLKKGKNKKPYRVLGRIHFFQTSNTGIYCRNTSEQSIYNRLYEIAAAHPEISFWIPPDDSTISAVVNIADYKKKILILFRPKKDTFITYDLSQYVSFIADNEYALTIENLYNLLT